MSRTVAVWLVVVAGLGFAVPAAKAEPVCPEPLIQGWEPWPPYQIARADGPSGIDIQIVDAIAARMGCAVERREMPWSRLLDSIAAGEVDFAVQANHTEDRAEFAYYSEPYLPYQTRLIVEAGRQRNYDSLRAFLAEGNTVGIVQDYDYGETVDGLLTKPRYSDQIIEAYSVGAHVRPLVRGRVDGVVAERFVFAHEAGKAGVRDEIAITGLTVTSVQTYAIFSKESTSEATVAAFNDAMAEVKADGTFGAIIDRYLEPGPSN